MNSQMCRLSCLIIMVFQICHNGANTGTTLVCYCGAFTPRLYQKCESITVDVTNTWWNAVEDIKNVLKPMITLITELLSGDGNIMEKKLMGCKVLG